MLTDRALQYLSGMALKPLKPWIIRIWGLNWRSYEVMAFLCTLQRHGEGRLGTIFLFLRIAKEKLACGVVPVAREALLICVYK